MIKSGYAVTPTNESADKSEAIKSQIAKLQAELKKNETHKRFLTASGDEIDKMLNNKSDRSELDKAFKLLQKIDELRRQLMKLNESIEMNESKGNPKLGKKVKQLKGWKIYQGTDSEGMEVFRCFTPDDDYPAVGYEDWETDTLDAAISWIKNY